jgi:hypothetical protein
MHRHGPCVVIARLDRIGAKITNLSVVMARFKRASDPRSEGIQYSAAKP